MKGYIQLAVPFMLGSILFEIVWCRLHGKRLYRLPDAVASLGTGIIDQTVGAALPFIAGVWLYLIVWKHFAIFHLRAGSPWTLAAAFVGADFCYYWWHRASHRCNFLWAGHVVHHQSEDFNLSTALRQNPITSLTSVPFYLPLAVIGIPVGPFVGMKSLMILYQFWIHTQLVRRLGPIELVMNTPSHHRVHHGIDPKYVDRNYAGAFIVWDRIFGTFEQEIETPTYGVLKPLHSFNPLWAILQPWHGMINDMRGRSLWDCLRIAYYPPGWRPEQKGEPDLKALFERVQRFDPQLPKRRAWGILAVFVVFLVAGSVVAQSVLPNGTPAARVFATSALLFGLGALGRFNM
jgi:sterol desaturase/sphingolipid hydroxylase (fatty acid hydroxylase superfamily)